MKKITQEQALHRLAAYCSRGERCLSDLRKKMDAWELPYSEQNKIIDRLKKEKFVDEERFCRAYVKDKMRYNGWGIYKVKNELKKKQIDDSLVENILQAVDTGESKERLKQILAQKEKTVKGKSDYEVKQKLIRFALGRGFALKDILELLKME